MLYISSGNITHYLPHIWGNRDGVKVQNFWCCIKKAQKKTVYKLLMPAIYAAPAVIYSLTLHSFVHLFVHSFIRLFVCLFIRSFICLFVRSFICLFIRSFVRLFVHSFICLFIHSFNCSFVCLYVCSFICSFIHSFVHSSPSTNQGITLTLVSENMFSFQVPPSDKGVCNWGYGFHGAWSHFWRARVGVCV